MGQPIGQKGMFVRLPFSVDQTFLSVLSPSEGNENLSLATVSGMEHLAASSRALFPLEIHV